MVADTEEDVRLNAIMSHIEMIWLHRPKTNLYEYMVQFALSLCLSVDLYFFLFTSAHTFTYTNAPTQKNRIMI